jgi:hypothetical protein
MKGYIYSMYKGADPAMGWIMNDPIFASRPTLGSCVPNIRRNVQVGDWIFVISGRVKSERQYVVGGFMVEEKIDQLSALARFPELVVTCDPAGHVLGNIIVNPDGSQRADDGHANFETRLENYLVGCEPIEVRGEKQVKRARAETLPVLSGIFGKEGNRPFDIIGRARSMDADQVNQLRLWLREIRAESS